MKNIFRIVFFVMTELLTVMHTEMFWVGDMETKRLIMVDM